MPIIEYNMNRQIEKFYRKHTDIFRVPLEKIINKMVSDIRYENGESLERHNFGNHPIKLTKLPTTTLDNSCYENELIKVLKGANIEDKTIIELLWGDIQLGKRIHACIIMWISTFVLKRPVLYIFRNLKIDRKQLMNDITGVAKHDFNITYIRDIFNEFSEEISEDWKDYKLPELKDINDNDNLFKLSNKDKLDPKDILCCLMNHKQLEKINNQLTEYIKINNELINLTVLTDESDLYAPSASHDNKNDKDIIDATKCEKLLATIYLKVKYVLHITGTAHSLLYNTNTRLNQDESVQLKVTKIHKMKRKYNYYGLFNNNINYNTSLDEWWNEIDDNTGKKYKYNIISDYQRNIKRIISEIVKRDYIIYNSLLISEEKIKRQQFGLVHNIISDFENIFLLVFHGKCLRLYTPGTYIDILLKYSKSEGRLFKEKGISIKTDFKKYENANELPNNYYYIDINDKLYNIKQIYIILSLLIRNEKCASKTVITITGKYGERGYSFTSDDYNENIFHITDQYFPCHVKNKNCTDISQRLRIQGKYNDKPVLNLWTSNNLKDIMEAFYIPFIRAIEKDIMSCETYEEIRDLIEGLIDTNEQINFDYMKYIGPSKYKKNIKKEKRFDSKYQGYRLIQWKNMSNTQIEGYCSENKLPKYHCVNEIKDDLTWDQFLETNSWLKIYPSVNYKKVEWAFQDVNKDDYYNLQLKPDTPDAQKKKLTTYIENEKINSYASATNARTQNIASKPIRVRNHIDYSVHIFEFDPNKYILSKVSYKINKLYFIDEHNNLLYSKLKSEYKDDPNYNKCPYYWKTPNGWLYLYNPNSPPIISIAIKRDEDLAQEQLNMNAEVSDHVKIFKNECIGKPQLSNIRIGINILIKHYKKWCGSNNCVPLVRNKLKQELAKLNIKEETSKGVDINGNSGKRGYNVSLL